jgi:hypothetical protein
VNQVRSSGIVRIQTLASLAALCLAVPCVAQEVDFPEVDGWSVESEVRVFTADNLWEYINGAAELFVEYDVQLCMTGDMASGDLMVTVDYYDMGTPLNAFGVYVRERPDPSISLPGVTEAVISPPYQALILKGSMYVKVNVFDGELTEAGGRSLVEAIARELPGPVEYPAELELLPARGRLPGTAGFQREGFLGLTELPDCLYAEYSNVGAESWQGFAMLPSAHESADATWERLSGAWDSVEHNGHTVLFREIPYRGLVGVVKTGNGIVGASGAADQAQLLERLGSLHR